MSDSGPIRLDHLTSIEITPTTRNGPTAGLPVVRIELDLFAGAVSTDVVLHIGADTADLLINHLGWTPPGERHLIASKALREAAQDYAEYMHLSNYTTPGMQGESVKAVRASALRQLADDKTALVTGRTNGTEAA